MKEKELVRGKEVVVVGGAAAVDATVEGRVEDRKRLEEEVRSDEEVEEYSKLLIGELESALRLIEEEVRPCGLAVVVAADEEEEVLL